MFAKSHKSIAILFAYFYLHVFMYLIYILCVFLSFLDTNFSQVHSVRCSCMSIIRIHLKNIRTNIKIGITHSHCILVGIRDFQAKSGQLDGLVTNSLPIRCFTLLAPTSHPIKIPELPLHQTFKVITYPSTYYFLDLQPKCVGQQSVTPFSDGRLLVDSTVGDPAFHQPCSVSRY